MHPILKSYIPIVNMITQRFGKNCEVSIHDLTQPESSVVYVANGTIIRNRDIGNLKRKDNIGLIRFMDEKGVFLVKGAIDKVAESLDLSKVTIYSYLDEVRGKK